ncbi:MAG TPA: signal peptidase II, partial [Thermoleophilaceae bacterium]|nr:signal peptidase II [Thermoleophilaceae bacterium]
MRTSGPAAALATAGLVVALDQATKQLAVTGIGRGEEKEIFFGLDLTNARNSGVAFGAFEGAGVLVGVLIGLSLALLLGYFLVHRERPWLWLPGGLLLG